MAKTARPKAPGGAHLARGIRHTIKQGQTPDPAPRGRQRLNARTLWRTVPMDRFRSALIVVAMAVIAYDGATHPSRLYVSLVIVFVGVVGLTRKRRLGL